MAIQHRTILFVAQHLYPASGGGTGRYVYDAARQLARRGVRVTVLLPRAARTEPAETGLDSVRILRFGGAGYFFLKRFIPQTFLDMAWAAVQVRRVMRAEAFDLVAFHHLPVTPLALLLPAVRRTPRLYHFYASVYQEWRFEHAERYTAAHRLFGAFLQAVERFTFARMPRIITLSAESARILQEDFGIPTETVIRFRGAVDTEQFAVPRRDNGLYWPQASAPKLLSVRRLEKRMGLTMLIDAVGLLHKHGHRVQLVIAGKGPLAAELQRRIAAYGLEEYVTLAGFVPDADLAGLYASADVFVLPTVALEGFGLVTVEAMAAGAIPVTTAVGATPEIVSAVDDALMATEANAPALAAAIERVLRLPAADKAAVRQRAIEVARERYGWRHAAIELENIYERAVNQ